MKSSKIIVNTESKSYPIFFNINSLKDMGKLIKKNLPNVKKICIIADKNLPYSLIKKLNISLKKYNPKVYKLPAKEKTKDIKVAEKIIQNLLKNNFNRSDCIISFGGGILSDLSAFVASLTKRGLKFVNIPTTLLAQADASIGGKTGINSSLGKNLIGTFYQPDFVLVDISLLYTLPRREMICGYGEILKHSLISDKKFFLWLTKNGKKIINKQSDDLIKKALIKSCKIKSSIISKDEKEKNLRMILNFGHTFAHGFEGAKKFSNRLNHGEAVLLGMIVASEFSYKNRLLKLKDFLLIKKHYHDLNLPSKIKKYFNKSEVKKIIYFMKKDKKNINNKINLILIKKLGKTTKPNSFTTKSSELKKFLNSIYN